ncbi:hypothetical protein GW750_08140 [bacterium]|nr:hypothetical protein [bacterium]
MKNREDRKDRIIAFSNSTEEDLDFAINVEDDKLRPLLKEKQQQEASIQALAEEIAKELKDLSTEELLNFNIQSENKKDLQEVIDSIESGELDNNIDALLFNKKLIEIKKELLAEINTKIEKIENIREIYIEAKIYKTLKQ